MNIKRVLVFLLRCSAAVMMLASFALQVPNWHRALHCEHTGADQHRESLFDRSADVLPVHLRADVGADPELLQGGKDTFWPNADSGFRPDQTVELLEVGRESSGYFTK